MNGNELAILNILCKHPIIIIIMLKSCSRTWNFLTHSQTYFLMQKKKIRNTIRLESDGVFNFQWTDSSSIFSGLL